MHRYVYLLWWCIFRCVSLYSLQSAQLFICTEKKQTFTQGQVVCWLMFRDSMCFKANPIILYVLKVSRHWIWNETMTIRLIYDYKHYKCYFQLRCSFHPNWVNTVGTTSSEIQNAMCLYVLSFSLILLNLLNMMLGYSVHTLNRPCHSVDTVLLNT